MSKPIFIVRIPSDFNINNIEEGLNRINNQLDDYHFIPMRDSSVDRAEFECYNSPHTEIEFEELKKIVTDSLNLT